MTSPVMYHIFLGMSLYVQTFGLSKNQLAIAQFHNCVALYRGKLKSQFALKVFICISNIVQQGDF